MVFLAALLVLAPQQSPSAQLHKDKMKELAFLAEDWVGEGWQKRGDGRDAFTGSESVKWSAGGTALVFEGHQANAAGAERYNGLVVITWNAPKDCYRFVQQTSAGTYAEYEAHLEGKVLVWKLRDNLAVRLSVNNGEWLEEGFLKTGDAEEKIFELKMKPKPTIK